MIELTFCLAMLAALGPLTAWGVRFVKKRRGVATAFAALTLMFGISAHVAPPPPPPPEVPEPELEPEEERDDEPK